MAACPRCSTPLPETARICVRCGAVLPSAESASTVTTPRPRRRDDARFVPGTVIGRRYRIVARAGRGGMGEVYRADDLRLGQPVALKFLPQSLESDPGRLELLLDEVKGARQVSHPNVCRVWDIGEAEGLHFVAMEYVDGEDLGSLLRRIGRLPEDRGVQVAREICSGLAAIHDQGLLHRDLKPSNVMLDGRGHTRITDFGLAARPETIVGADVGSGTPAYMAPEVLEGLEVTARSDIYSLGLVLYELFTGRHAFDSGRTPTRRDSESRPESPSTLVRTLDPVVERAILRCLEVNPGDRPSSARAVAQALPGGDPLAAAMSLGETPSPGMVAVSGGVGGLTALAAVSSLVYTVVALVGVLALSESRGLPFGPDDRSYAVLQDRAGDLMRAMGSANPGGQMRDGFSRVTAAAPGMALRAARGDVFYWQRRSPLALYPVAEERLTMGGSAFAIPDLQAPGEAAVRLDLQGRLLEFRRFPSTRDPAVAKPDWSPLFAAAGIRDAPEIADGARALAPVPTDARQAWLATTPKGDRQIEGGTFHGTVTFFSVGPPYMLPAVTIANLIGGTIFVIVFLSLFGMSLIVARRNLTVGRADLRGALRLAGAAWLVSMLGWGLSTPQFSWPGSILGLQVVSRLFLAGFTATSYLALEPIVRRRRPQWLASWNRMLDGKWLDPLVGRHVVIGTAAGLALSLISGLRGYLDRTVPNGDFQSAAVGAWMALGVVTRGIVGGTLLGFLLSLFLVLLQIAVRKDRFGFVAWIVWALLAATFWYAGLPRLVTLPLSLAQAALMGLVLHRSGVLALVVAGMVLAWLNEEYLTIHVGAWYSGVTIAALIAIAVLMTWGVAAGLRARRDPRSA